MRASCNRRFRGRVRELAAAAVATVLAALSIATSAGAGTAPVTGLRIEGERLSLGGEPLALTDILDALGRAGIRVDFHGDPARIDVADSFESLDVARAFSRILSARSHILIDHEVVAGRRRIEVILLGATDTALRSFDLPSAGRAGGTAERPGETAEMLLSRATAGSPEERAAAAEALAYAGDGAEGSPAYGEQVLLQMLSDPEESIRARAIETIKDTADEIPFAALAQVAREDASPDRRIQALELLVERSAESEAQEPLRVALNDAEPAVRRRARELALDWHIVLDPVRRSSN